MKAVYLRDLKEIEPPAKYLPPEAAWIAHPDTRIFSQTSRLHCFPFTKRIVSSLYYRNPPNVFETIAVSRNLRLFDNNWSKALLRELNESLRPDGRLIVACGQNRSVAREKVMTLRHLEALFGNPAERVGDGFAVFRKASSIPPIASILPWYFQRGAQLIDDDVFNHGLSVGSLKVSDLCTLAPSFLVPNGDGGEPQGNAVDGEGTNPASRNASFPALSDALHKQDAALEEQPLARLAHSVKRQNYYVSGINLKSAVLWQIFDSLLPGRSDLRVVDIGGGYGLLSWELMLSAPERIEKVVNVDISAFNLLLSCLLYCDLRGLAKSNYQFCLSSAEEFGFSEDYDAVLFMGSLLYVKKNRLHDTLVRAYEALRPGGLVIVYENIKTDPSHKDSGYMFTVKDLDSALGQFGIIARFEATTAAPVSEQNADDRPVFRVVQKAGAGTTSRKLSSPSRHGGDYRRS